MLTNLQKTFQPAPLILQRAQTGTQMGQNKAVNIIMSVLIAMLAMMTEAVIIIPAIVIIAIRSLRETGSVTLNMNTSGMTPVMLYSTAMPILALILYVRFVEKRSVRSMGFIKEKAVPDYLIGMAAAVAMFSAGVGICVAAGAMTFDGYVLNGQYALLAAFFVGFLIQGMSEEVVCRGFMLTSVGSKSGALIGMLVNSLLFGLLHLGNSGVTVFSLVNIVLFGVLMSVIVLKRNSIWLAAALHSIWNFVQGNFFGILVSGIDAGPSVFRCTPVEGMDWLSGGSFGMEGGAATTIVLAVAITVALLMKPREGAQKIPAPSQTSAE